MSRFEHRVERDLAEIAEHASPSPDAWLSILDRIDRAGSETIEETTMLDSHPTPDARRRWIPRLAAAAIVVLVGVIAAFALLDDDDRVQVTDQPSGPTTVAPDGDDELEPGTEPTAPVSDTPSFGALLLDGEEIMLIPGACGLEERPADDGSTQVISAYSEGNTESDQRVGVRAVRTRSDDGTVTDTLQLLRLTDDGVGSNYLLSAEERLFTVDDRSVQAIEQTVDEVDGDDTATLSFTIDC